jgi:hypothetical protein
VIYVALAIALVLFVAVLRLGRVVERSLAVVATVRHATADMTSSTLSEDEKEIRIQREAVAMMRAFSILMFWSLAAAALSVAVVVLGAQFDFYDLESLTAAAQRWDVIIVTGVVMTVLLVARRR